MFVWSKLWGGLGLLVPLVAACAAPVDPILIDLSGEREPSTDLERAAVEIWMVGAFNAHCGGFLRSPALVITAAHCIPEGHEEVLFRQLGSNALEPARVESIDRVPERDIAFLSPINEKNPCLESRSLHNGEHGTLLRPLWGTRISGKAEFVRFDDGITRSVLWGPGALGGDSGSPVVADDGRVIGIVSSGVWAAPGTPLTGVTLVPVFLPSEGLAPR